MFTKSLCYRFHYFNFSRRNFIWVVTQWWHSKTYSLIIINIICEFTCSRWLDEIVISIVCFSGISSVVLSEEGEGLYLHSSSELERVTVSAAKVTSARCKVHLPPSTRCPVNNDDASSESSAASQPSVNTNGNTSVQIYSLLTTNFLVKIYYDIVMT